MRKWTIAELRERDVERLAKRSAKEGMEAEARKALNSYYRLAAFSIYKFEIENNERSYTRALKSGYLAAMEEREERWIARLNEYLKPFNCEVTWTGLYPSLVVFGKYHRIDEVVTNGYFYD